MHQAARHWAPCDWRRKHPSLAARPTPPTRSETCAHLQNSVGSNKDRARKNVFLLLRLTGPDVGKFRPREAEFRPMWANFGEHFAKFDQNRRVLAR